MSVAGSYPNMGPRNAMNQAYTMDPDPDVKQQPVDFQAGAAQNPNQAASQRNALGPTPDTHPSHDMSTRYPYDQTTANANAKGYDMPTAPDQSVNTDPDHDGATTCGAATGRSVRGAFQGVHGAGEMIRGNVLSAFDRAAGKTEAASKNAAIAEAGRQEMRNGFAACSNPRQRSR